MSLPDNVTVNTEYVVRSTDDVEVFNDITVTRGDRGNVFLRQDSDTVALAPADVPGLIAALTAAAGLDVPTVPALPAYVIDGDGERHELASDGTYRLCLRDGTHGHIRRTLGYIRAELGIRSEG